MYNRSYGIWQEYSRSGGGAGGRGANWEASSVTSNQINNSCYENVKSNDNARYEMSWDDRKSRQKKWNKNGEKRFEILD